MTILVIGATGTTGRPLVEQLLAAGRTVRALTRDPAGAGLPDGAEVVKGDTGDPGSLRAALTGVRGVFTVASLAFESELVGLAVAAGVERMVSMTTDAVVEGIDMGAFRAFEESVEAAGLEWTHVRPGEFAANKRDQWGPSIKAEGVVRTAYPDVVGAPVHEADIAAVALAALTGPGHHGKAYQVRGPQLSQREQARAIGAAIGRELRVERVTHSRERQGMIDLGFPAWAADHVLSYPVRWADEPCETTGDVLAATGRPPRDFATWARDHAADFA